MLQRGIAKESREIIQRILENRVVGYRKDLKITKEEHPLYRKAVGVMDKVRNA